MPALRELEIAVSDHLFNDLELKDRFAWEHQFSETELLKVPLVETIARMTQLKSLTLSFGWCLYTNTKEKKVTFERNLEALEKIIKKRIQAAQLEQTSGIRSQVATDDNVTTCSPLYRGSKVCSACSLLLRPKLAKRGLNRLWKR